MALPLVDLIRTGVGGGGGGGGGIYVIKNRSILYTRAIKDCHFRVDYAWIRTIISSARL